MAGKRLEGKVAVITGTGGAQGRAAALLFAREGARIVGCDLKEDASHETADLVQSAGGQMVSCAGAVDLADEDTVEAFIAFAVEQYGDFDILYNNAATFVRGRSAAELTRAEWDFSFANEVTLIFLAVKHALPVFIRRGGGSVLNIASVAGMVGSGLPGNAVGNLVHSVFKGTVIRLTESLAIELAKWNVRVNTISPGPIETAAVARFVRDPRLRAVFEGSSLLGRMGRPEDVASAALFLVSDEAAYITGVNLPVDGGYAVSGGLGVVRDELQQLYGSTDTPGAAAV
jgi:NAD(P)-dependent dehydrogenase (short-subunit alcohol dehydrogenase family)